MVGHRSSPRCSYCGQRGHAKNHCPEIKRLAEQGSENCKRILQAQKDAVKNRKCSYCHQTGHNKRSCQVKVADKVVFDKIIRDYHKEAEAVLKAKGFTIGSLVRYSNRGLKEVDTLALVTEVSYNKRAPDWDWSNKRLEGYTEEERRSYNRYCAEAKDYKEGVNIKLESLTGTGLGYWGDSDKSFVDIDSLNIYEWINHRRLAYEVVS